MESRCFLSRPTKKLSPKWRENWREKLDIIFGQKCPCATIHGLVHVALFIFLFFLFLFLSSWTLPLLPFFIFFIYWAGFLVPTHPVLILFIFFFFFFCFLLCFFVFVFVFWFFFFLFRCDFFFLDMIFIF